MDEIYTRDTADQPGPDIAAVVPGREPVGVEQVRQWLHVLQNYKAGKAKVDARVIAAENWWKLRNTAEERNVTEIGKDGGWVTRSGWLHNVITNKHADAMESFPEPNILPRESGDKAQARMLTSIVPVVLERNKFRRTYSDAMWSKAKSGTGVYKVTWDSSLLNGLGDISVEEVPVLNLFWEPNCGNIQKSRYLFHVEQTDKDLLAEQYPQIKDTIKSSAFVAAQFLYDEVDSSAYSDKVPVIDVYYHKSIGGRNVLHYCKFVGESVLYASENVPEYQERGYYDHGKYPYVFDTLFPIEGSPCGYGYVDVCQSPQIEIDLMKTAFVKNSMVGAVPRYLVRSDGAIDEKEFMDLSKATVHVNGSLDESFVRLIQHTPLDGNYVNMLNSSIQELRETSGNTETSTGNISSGVTAASAIAALQEASGKGSRDATGSSYDAYTEVVELCIELIRQFYDMPRQFRIVGQYGAEQFVSFSNAGIQAQPMFGINGEDMGMRLPVFDIKIVPQKRNVYTKVTQNELAVQFFNMGIFNPALADQTLMMLDMMEFDGKDELMQKISTNAMMAQKLMQYMQMALGMAQQVRPDLVEMIMMDMQQTMAQLGQAGMSAGGAVGSNIESDAIAGIRQKEPTIVQNARARSGSAAQPSSAPARRN